jgi:outer membrane protein assembly factor BamB
MNRCLQLGIVTLASLVLLTNAARSQDWPQWRGPNRDARAPGFQAPANWPATLRKSWDVTIGEGDSNPSLAGDRLYTFSREDGQEVVRCLNAATGAEIWKKSYPSDQITGGDAGHAGPRSTPTVANGKVITYGVNGHLVCWNAADGSQAWKKDEFIGKTPQFHTSSSPIVVDGMCIVQAGGQQGAMVAYDLATGDEKWRAREGSDEYSSPVLMTVDGMKVVFAVSTGRLVTVNAANGKVVWNIAYSQGRNNSATPIVDGQTLIVAGPGNGVGMTAWRMAKEGDMLKETQLWQYGDNPMVFSSPLLKDGKLYGLSGRDQLFCAKIENGQATTAWTAPIAATMGLGQWSSATASVFAQPGPPRGDDRGGRGGPGGPGGGRGGRGGRGGGGGGGGYGSVVDAGSVLLAISPAAELVVFKPTDAKFEPVARYKVSEDGATYSHPIPSGNRIYIKDRDSVAMFTVE